MRTRRPLRLDDDPRTPRGNRKKSGVNLMHEEPFYGYNAARALPVRDTEDPSGNPFSGLPANRIKYQGLTNDEFGADEVDSRVLSSVEGNRAVDSGNAKDQFLVGRHFSGVSAPYRLPSGVKIALGSDVDGSLDVDNLGGGGAGHQIAAGLIPNIAGLNGDLPAARIQGTVAANNLPNLAGMNGLIARGKLDDFLNGDRLIKEGTLRIESLSSQPWANKTTDAEVRDIVRQMVKATSLK